MAMLCELIDKYFVETLLCSGGGKMSIRDIHREGVSILYITQIVELGYTLMVLFIKHGEMNGEAV